MLNRAGLYDFYHQLRIAVRTRYLETEAARRASHQQLAEYFLGQPDWIEGQASEPIANSRKTGELPWQQAEASLWGDLETTLGRFDFLDAKNQTFGPWPLVEDFDRLIRADDEGLAKLRDRDAILLLQSALKLSANTLAGERSQLAEQLTGRLLTVDSPLLRSILARAAQTRTKIWLQPLTASLTPPRQALLQTLFEGPASVRAFVVIPESDKLVAGSGSTLTVLDLNTGEELHGLDGSGVITAVVTLGDRGIIASGDREGSINIWNVNSGELLQTLQSRSKVVGLLSCDNGEILVSSNHDVLGATSGDGAQTNLSARSTLRSSPQSSSRPTTAG